MPRPLPFDQPQTYWSPHYPNSQPSHSTPSPTSTVYSSTSPYTTRGTTSTSPFYGLEPEYVARMLENSPNSTIHSDLNSNDPILPFTNEGNPTQTTSNLTRRYSASSLNPIRPTTRIRTPSPPPHPFDGNEGSTSAWLRWLGERRARRVEAEGGDPVRAAQNPNDPLRRLRQSAERLRTVESRMEGSAVAEDTASAPSQVVDASTAYEESRVLLAEVRQRLDDTRMRIADARAMAGEETDGNSESRAGEGSVQARQGLERTVVFATRLGQLASTLTDLSERAAALTNSPSRAFTPSSRIFSPSIPSTGTSPESPASAAQTDSIRHTIRQLIVASRRVSAAIDRHREATSHHENSSPTSSASPPLPATNIPLRVSLPSPLRSSSSNADSPQLDLAQTTSPNPDGLLLPSRPFTHSPLSLPNNGVRGLDVGEGENYPGERAQLLRIAALQRDIASRALELRELRARGRELDREERESRRLRAMGSGEAGVAIDAEKEEEERNWSMGRLGREVEVEASSSGDETIVQPHQLQTKEEKRRRYELYAFCGR
ncbi:hypothetical protein JCM5353_008160 [Sporobolomyces roseus]